MSELLTIVTWLWGNKFRAEHVGAVQAMLAEHLHMPYRFVCVTDQPNGLDCETVPLWDAPRVDMPDSYPNCWRRLYAFSDAAKELFGPRFLSIDLDVIILDDITGLFETDSDFKIAQGMKCPYNGSMWMHRSGSHPEVWNDFDPATSPGIVTKETLHNHGRPYYGSDQAWMSYKLPGAPTWGRDDGVYQFGMLALHGLFRRATGRLDGGNERRDLPENCRIVFFAGPLKPWSPRLKGMHPPLYESYQKYLIRHQESCK